MKAFIRTSPGITVVVAQRSPGPEWEELERIPSPEETIRIDPHTHKARIEPQAKIKAGLPIIDPTTQLQAELAALRSEVEALKSRQV
jgi:hypothetical protein